MIGGESLAVVCAFAALFRDVRGALMAVGPALVLSDLARRAGRGGLNSPAGGAVEALNDSQKSPYKRYAHRPASP
jgi:hypothetical protein